ncbi:MAG: HAD-IIIA family hydrolase, partial [Planctomycetota bacterium]
FFLVLVTNQSGVGRGLMSRRALEDIHRRMQAVLGESAFDAIHYCHHHPQAGCVCRKPSPWMILRACAALGLNPRASFLVGDSARDIEMGRAAGCRTIFCGRAAGDCRPDKTVRTVRAAVEWILRNKQREA